MTSSTHSKDILMVDTPQFDDVDHTPPMQNKVEPEVHQEEPIISLHALSSILAPQTLKLWGYIKHHKIIVLVDSGNTHNFMHRQAAEETHCYVHLVSNV